MKQTRKRTGRDDNYCRILWPTDFSSFAQAALPHAVRLTAAGKGELVVLHVLSALALYAMPEIASVAWEQLDKDNRVAAQAKLDRVTERLRSTYPRLRVRGVLSRGAAVEGILRAAKRLRSDLIVLATHGRTGLGHVFLGSVAENVVRRAPCPVLSVRPRGLGRSRG